MPRWPPRLGLAFIRLIDARYRSSGRPSSLDWRASPSMVSLMAWPMDAIPVVFFIARLVAFPSFGIMVSGILDDHVGCLGWGHYRLILYQSVGSRVSGTPIGNCLPLGFHGSGGWSPSHGRGHHRGESISFTFAWSPNVGHHQPDTGVNIISCYRLGGQSLVEYRRRSVLDGHWSILSVVTIMPLLPIFTIVRVIWDRFAADINTTGRLQLGSLGRWLVFDALAWSLALASARYRRRLYHWVRSSPRSHLIGRQDYCRHQGLVLSLPLTPIISSSFTSVVTLWSD